MSLVQGAGLHACYRRLRPPRAPGFTLLEILIAASIFSIIAVILYGSFSVVLNSVERVDEDQTLLRIADFLVTHFEQNISSAYLPSVGTMVPGVQGVEFVGEDREGTDGRPADALTFYTTAARMGGGALPGDTKQVAYALVEDKDKRSVFTVYEKPRLLLPMTSGDDKVLSNEPAWAVPMASIDFKYYDGSEWLDSWNSGGMQRLPYAVRIEAHFVEEKFEFFMDEIGMEKPVLVMVVSIPLGLAQQQMRGA